MNLYILNYRIHVFRVSAKAVVVEAITHHKVVRNLFAAVAHVELDLQFCWFEQECTDVDAGWILSFQGEAELLEPLELREELRSIGKNIYDMHNT